MEGLIIILGIAGKTGERLRAGQGIYIKVKQSRNRPSVAQRVPGDLDSQIS